MVSRTMIELFLANLHALINDDNSSSPNHVDHNYFNQKNREVIDVGIQVTPDTVNVGIQVNVLFKEDAKFLDFITKDEDVLAFTNIPTVIQFEKLAALLESTLVKIDYTSASNFKLWKCVNYSFYV